MRFSTRHDARLWSACLALFALLVSSADVALAQDPGGDMQEVFVKTHRLRFAVPKAWTVKETQGIYVANSPDNKLLFVVVLLDKPAEIPEAFAQLDKMVVVTGTEFGKATTSVQGMIPMQTLPGSGTLQPSGAPVELLSVTLNVLHKPVVGMFYVHKSAFDVHIKMVAKILSSITLVVNKAEAVAIKKELEAWRAKGTTVPF